MFYLDNPDLILQNVCSIQKQCIIYIYYPLFLSNPGQLKLIRWAGNAVNFIADSSTHQLKNLTLSNIQNPNKIKQNLKFHPSYHLSYPISLKPTKIKHFSHFQTKNQTSILPKITPTILFSSLYISVFTDNDFSIKSHTQESQPIGRYIKTISQITF